MLMTFSGIQWYHYHKNMQINAGSYSQLFHLLHAHRHAAGLLGDKPAQWQGKVNAQQDKIKLLYIAREENKERGQGQKTGQKI